MFWEGLITGLFAGVFATTIFFVIKELKEVM